MSNPAHGESLVANAGYPLRETRAGSGLRVVRLKIAALILCCFNFQFSIAQGLHFSQIYNAPMLVSPANTGLMSDKDYRFGMNYRTQWGAVPVPYTTFSAYGDAQVFRRMNGTNWLGVGGSIFTDKCGDGSLSLTRWEGDVAYHIQLGEYQMVSFGASVAGVQRTVDLSKFSFDAQWSGFSFDRSLPNGERSANGTAGYFDLGAGINYAIYPSELVYIKFGTAFAHINNPKESFYGQSNVVGMRGTGYIDVLARVGDRVVVNPSLYFTEQSGANEFVYGTLVSFLMGDNNTTGGSFITGIYNRWNDAVIGTFGYEWRDIRFMASYDYTISQLSPYNNHYGALEFGIRYQGSYGAGASRRELRSLNCPRF